MAGKKRIPRALHPDPRPPTGKVICARGCKRSFTPDVKRVCIGWLVFSDGRRCPFFTTRCPRSSCRRVVIWCMEDREASYLSEQLIEWDKRSLKDRN